MNYETLIGKMTQEEVAEMLPYAIAALPLDSLCKVISEALGADEKAELVAWLEPE